MGSQGKLSSKQSEELLATLQARFEKNMNRHEGLAWADVQARLEANLEKLWPLHEMERTGGEPDVVGRDEETGEYLFYDCAAQSPAERRSLCYDRAAWEARKANKPGGNAVDTAALPRWEPTAANAGVVGAVSKFRPVKNIPLLTEGYALVPADVRRRLLLVGYWAEYCDDERARADAIAARAGIHDEITVTGALPAADVPAQLLKMRVFALTSTFEGMSNALLEALAVGTPVVTTTIAGLEEHAVDGEHLLRVDAMDAPALARALDAVLRDEALARRLSQGARALAAHYSLAAERQRWFDLYGELLAARAQPAR